ncbi:MULTISPECIES: hypothetical protein [Paraburkholderia]|uniref:hypothetical protein n=1 Tax=Paraburkholderia TaxID=1822464 RepID=UPI002259DFCE|nr:MULTISPECIES: hypothetical protein [Paraburkholderia]MCX4160997.1 hypothetical protein [Paraburkholderia megapolitana]MDN7156493.1 hypothetical protein [Paraburkholderia sp. CHISQ3]MDQ6493538.1 hypothetical protein [Paraburkholderia megapolitana]
MAPMFMLWGVIWLIGFGLTDIAPAYANFIWIALNVVGVLGCIYLGQRGRHEDRSATSWRWLASMLSIFAFYILALVIFQPATGMQSAAFIALIVALFYVLAGLWLGARFAIAGTLLAALTLIGYFVLPAHFALWMAVAGGGALMLAGLWLRRA